MEIEKFRFDAAKTTSQSSVDAIKKAGGGKENSSERCKKTRSSWNDFSNRRNPPRSSIMWISRSTFLEREEGSVSTLAGAKREYRCAVSSLPGNGQSLFIRPAATRIGSGYNCRVPGKESSLVETMYYIYVYIYIYKIYNFRS